MESKKLYGASTQMTPAVYKDFYKTYYNEKLKVFKIVAEIVGLIAIFSAFYILANGYGILWGAIALWIGIQKVLETGKYFFIFHNSESVSIVDKAHFSGDVESFSGFIKTKTQYKKIK